MSTYVPYVYLVRFKPTGQIYYGSRYGMQANPSQLWVTYFTSSVIVKALIKEYGSDSFESEVRRTFETAAEATRWERRFLVKVSAKQNPMFLNRSDTVGDWKYTPTEEHKKTLSRLKKGVARSEKARLAMSKPRPHRIGVALSEEHVQKRAVAMIGKNLGKKRSTEQTEKMRKYVAGTRWMNLAGELKRVHVHQLQDHLDKGWCFGRSMRT